MSFWRLSLSFFFLLLFTWVRYRFQMIEAQMWWSAANLSVCAFYNRPLYLHSSQMLAFSWSVNTPGKSFYFSLILLMYINLASYGSASEAQICCNAIRILMCGQQLFFFPGNLCKDVWWLFCFANDLLEWFCKYGWRPASMNSGE